MKVDCVIVLGPSGEFYPLVGEQTQKFSLPFLNTPLLNLSINYLSPHASKFLIFCLKKYEKDVCSLVTEYEVPIEIITTESYEGMSHILLTAKSKIASPFFVMCKGDIYGLEPLNPILESFMGVNADMYLSLNRNVEEGSLMCLDSSNYLKMYNSEDFPFIKNEKLILTTNFALKDFYIIKTSVLNVIPPNLYSFKSNIIPYLIRLNKRIKAIENMIFQIRNINDYLLQLELKNNLTDMKNTSSCNILDASCNIGECAVVEDSIIGENCLVGYKSIVKRSIIMDNSTVEPYCIIESCVIGNNGYIKSKSELKNCKVGGYYTFECPIKASFNIFGKE